MADVKISELPPAASVSSSTILPTVTSGTTEQATVSQLANGLFSSVTPGTYGSSTYSAVLTVDNKGRITNINQAAISGGGSSSITGVFNVRNYGALGDGTTNDYVAINTALIACCNFNGGLGGTLYFPSGTYYINTTLSLVNRTGNITVLGDGPKTSIIKTAAGVCAISFQFAQVGATQPYAPTIANLGFQCAGAGSVSDAAIKIQYNAGSPPSSNYHLATGPTITNCEIRSLNSTQYWQRGIDIVAAWNTRIVDTYVSGYSDGNWNNLKGVGLFFHESCVNSSVLNCQFNFFIRGIKFENVTVASQGLTVTDCIFVGVQSGGYFECFPGLPYNSSSVIWTGGLVDIRISGTSPASPVPAFYAKNTDEITISNVQFVTDSLSVAACGVLLDNCKDVSVLNSVFYTFAGSYAIATVNTCSSVLVLGNRFKDSTPQVLFNSGSSRCIYRDSILEGSITDDYVSLGTNNIMEGSVAGAETTVYLNAPQSISSGAETTLSWTTALTPSQFGIWSSGANQDKLYVPTGAKKVRLTLNVRWTADIIGAYKEIKIKDSVGANEVWAASSILGYYGDQSITTPIIPVSSGTYFYATAFQNSGSGTSIRGVKATNFTLEVIA